MTDEKSEEFRRFILENRELIETILNEDKEKKEKSRKEELKEEFDERFDGAKTKAKDAGDVLLSIIGDDDVQKHFFTGCLEFLHFLEAVINAAPLSPEVREAVDKFEQTRDKTIKNVVSVGAKDRMDNIDVDEVKKKPSSPRKGKMESIAINEVKTSSKKKKE